jgi:hypothetical protein
MLQTLEANKMLKQIAIRAAVPVKKAMGALL